MRKSIDVNGFEIFIDCNEIMNLFIHTLNIYEILGNHGTKYKLRNDNRVRATIDEKIFEDVSEGDSYFSYGKLNIFRMGMEYILDNQIWKQAVNPENIRMGVEQKNFGLAFEKCWCEFYRDYWRETLSSREKLFRDCINAFDFAAAAEKMKIATHSDFTKEFYVFPAEPLANSGLKFRDNVCAGDLIVGRDIGFVHEGLHLLLQERWARNEQVIKTINESNYSNDDYGSWEAFYEQILVIGLDCCIRDHNDEVAKNYYHGCGVGNEFALSYPLIKDYYCNGCRESIESLMVKIITRLLK